MKVNIRDLISVYENDVVKNTKNKRKVFLFEMNKIQNIIKIKEILETEIYNPLEYNIFAIFEPKCRIVMSLSIRDKIINHYMAKFILVPRLEKYLDIRNCATRKNMGIHYANKLLKRYLCECKRNGEVYILKLDISKYFYSIDHNILKSMLSDKLSSDEFNIIESIIDSTNAPYINEKINFIKNSYGGKKVDELNQIPYYETGRGLSLGAMVSQFLSIFYLSSLDHFIIHNLHLKRYIRYMDDMICISNDKDYLIECKKIIEDKLLDEYNLRANSKKSKIYKAENGFIFLGYRYRVINDKIIVKLRNQSFYKIKNNIKKNVWLYNNNMNNLDSIYCSFNTYRYSYKGIKDYNINLSIDKAMLKIREKCKK